MLYHLGAFIVVSDLYPKVTEASAGLKDWFLYDRPPKTEDNNTAH